jgi:hypothetical protein
MNFSGRIISYAFSATIIGTAAPIWAQGKLDGDSFKLWGGTYSTNCADSKAPRLRVASDALMVEQGDKRLTGRNVQASYSFYGQSPPPDYQVALTGEVRGSLQLLFIVFQDKTGVYITLDGDREVQAALGKPLLGRKYRSCDGARRAATPPPAGAPVTAAPPGEAVTNPWDLLSDRKFKSAYYKVLGPKVREDWLATLDGPAVPTSKINVAGSEYVFASSCKNHDCADNNVVLLYSPALGKVYGKVFDRRRASLIGNPPAPVAAELDRLWISTYRRNR